MAIVAAIAYLVAHVFYSVPDFLIFYHVESEGKYYVALNEDVLADQRNNIINKLIEFLFEPVKADFVYLTNQGFEFQNQASAKTLVCIELLDGGDVAGSVGKFDESATLQSTIHSECSKVLDGLRGVLEEMDNNRIGTPDHRAKDQSIVERIEAAERAADSVTLTSSMAKFLSIGR